MRFILASASPQRKLLLEELDVAFTVIPSGIDESVCTEKDPVKRAQVLAKLKAEDVHTHHPDAWVLGCDTLVVSEDGTLLEKPVDADDARMMMKKHSGRASKVHSSLYLIGPGKKYFEDVSTTTIQFKKLSEDDIDQWIALELWKDRSGAFQIEGEGGKLIESYEGDYTGVVGLPVSLLQEMLRRVDLI